MRIDSTDAASMVQIKNTEMAASSIGTRDIKNSGPEIRSSAHMTEFEKRELPISEKVVIDAIEKANNAISGANRRFEFSIHEKTKAIMVKVINSDTNEVVREIPPEKILDMVATMWEMAGILVDERR